MARKPSGTKQSSKKLKFLGFNISSQTANLIFIIGILSLIGSIIWLLVSINGLIVALGYSSLWGIYGDLGIPTLGGSIMISAIINLIIGIVWVFFSLLMIKAKNPKK